MRIKEGANVPVYAKAVLSGLEADKERFAQIKDVVLIKDNGESVFEKKAINLFLLSMLEAKEKSPELNLPSVKICGFDVNVEMSFDNGALPLRKRVKQKPFSWKNDLELDKLLLLNQKINNGATIQSLKKDFEDQDRKCNLIESARQKSETDLKAFYELKEKIEIVFEGKYSKIFTKQQAEADLMRYPNITKSNYKNIDVLINSEISDLKKLNRNFRQSGRN